MQITTRAEFVSTSEKNELESLWGAVPFWHPEAFQNLTERHANSLQTYRSPTSDGPKGQKDPKGYTLCDSLLSICHKIPKDFWKG